MDVPGCQHGGPFFGFCTAIVAVLVFAVVAVSQY